MATASKQTTTITTDRITLQLSIDEAQAVYDVIGSVCGTDNTRKPLVDAVYDALEPLVYDPGHTLDDLEGELTFAKPDPVIRGLYEPLP